MAMCRCEIIKKHQERKKDKHGQMCQNQQDTEIAAHTAQILEAPGSHLNLYLRGLISADSQGTWIWQTSGGSLTAALSSRWTLDLYSSFVFSPMVGAAGRPWTYVAVLFQTLSLVPSPAAPIWTLDLIH